MTIDTLKRYGYHRPTDHYDAFQAIDYSEYVHCDCCGKLAGYVHGYIAKGGKRVQLCGDCSYKLDGIPVSIDQVKK